MPKEDLIDKQYRKSNEMENRFDEANAAESIFNFEKDVIGTINALMKNKTITDMYILLIKYLYNNGVKDFNEIKELLRKWTAIVLYHRAHGSTDIDETKKIEVKLFNRFGKKKEKITIEVLQNEVADGDSAFAELYNYDKNNKDYHEKYKAVIRYISDLGITKDDLVAPFQSAINYYYDFFSFSTKFSKYILNDNTKRYDMLIAELVNDSFAFNSFKFQVEREQFDNFVKNIREEQSSNYFRYYVLIGYIINLIIENNNLELKEHVPVKASAYYKLISGQKELTFQDISFYNKELNISKGDEIIGLKIDTSSDYFTEFDFIYNDKKYSFTKNGIIIK